MIQFSPLDDPVRQDLQFLIQYIAMLMVKLTELLRVQFNSACLCGCVLRPLLQLTEANL